MLTTKPTPHLPPSPKWMVMATLVVLGVYVVLWWTTDPPTRTTTTASSSSMEAPSLVTQDRYLLQIETIVGQLVQFNPLEQRSQLQGVINVLDDWERSLTLKELAQVAHEPRELLQQLSTHLRKQNVLVHDLIGLLQQLKAEYQQIRLTAPPLVPIPRAVDSPSIILAI